MAKIIIVGKAGSGKDYLAKKFIEKGFIKTIAFTSRPPRSTELNGIDYYFVSKEQFEEKIKSNELVEHKSFNGWYYGTSLMDWDISQIFIFTPSGIEDLKTRGLLIDCLIIYLDIPENIRRERLSLRSDSDSVERRIIADEKDFENFTNYNLHITNHNF